ncbi:hypothetical protein, partial [Parabacteroides johnsonii]|uniref:hypothetical protein n=1 Tax=Parabacteroides johnsonii TaxID=387661 RepID=UPI0022E75B72
IDTLGDDYILIPQDFGMIPKERFYFIQNKFIWSYFYTIGDYNKYLNTIRGLIGRCNRYFRR